MSVKNNIYNYFDLNPELKVLFVFDPFICEELADAEWDEGFKAVKFEGNWFTVKYALANEWKDLKVILFFDRKAPTSSEVFPLMDVLTANMEYKSESYEAFIQQHRLDADKYAAYIQTHIGELQLQKFDKILHDYYTPETFSLDVANRGFICGYMGESKLLDWEEIFLRLFSLALPNEEKKETNFYIALSKNKDAAEALEKEMRKTFGVAYDLNEESKLKPVVESLKYNAITQLLVADPTDYYKRYKIHDAIILQRLNKFMEVGLNQPKAKRTQFVEAINHLAVDIKVSRIAHVYGIDANYLYVPEELCFLMVQQALDEISFCDTDKVRERMQVLRLKLEGNERAVALISYVLTLANFYDQLKQASNFVLNTANEYVARYVSEFYLLDLNYRQSLEIYTNLPNDTLLQSSLEQAKHKLDIDYLGYTNQLNHEWLKCWKEEGGKQKALDFHTQQDFYANEHVNGKKQVVIVSDALRYEVAAELLQELGKEKHVAKLDGAIAMLPTETKFTKTALLPHHSLTLQGVEMAVDGQVLRTIDQRTTHLQKYVDDAICIDYMEWDKLTMDAKRAICKNPLVYIFHNTIDKDGHDSSAYELTRGCRTAINQLTKLVKGLHASQNVTNVTITADHGFLYNDINIEEKDKLPVNDTCEERKTRYYLTTSDEPQQDVVKFQLSDVSEMQSTLYVAVPSNANRFNAPGGGYSFAHGGATLQEMIIPVITSRAKREEKTEKVGVTLISRDLKMVSSRLKFQIIQSEPVSMNMLERTICCAVYVDDQPVTKVKEIVLNSTDAVNAANRISDIDLVLNTSTDASIMQLRIFDKDDEMNPLVKENVKNNTIIEMDF